MDINTLRVFNVIHKLGITEQEFADLEEEQTHEDRTGLYVRCVKKGHAICVSHDDKHIIAIIDIPNHVFAPCRILFKTQFCFDVPEEIYTLHGIAQYRTADATIKYQAENMEQLKDLICDGFYTKSNDRDIVLGAALDRVCYPYDDDKTRDKERAALVQKQILALHWLFNQEVKQDTHFSRDNVPRILKVFERNNRRLAIIQKIDNYRINRCMPMRGSWVDEVQGTEIIVRTYKPNDIEYDYVDVNRELYIDYDSEVWVSDELFEKISYHELEVICKRSEEKWIYLTPDKYSKCKTLVKIEAQGVRRENEQNAARELLRKNIEKQFRKGSVTRQGITFTKESIEYEGIAVKHPAIGEFILENNLHLVEEPDFRAMVLQLLCHVLRFCARRGAYSEEVLYYDCDLKQKETIQIGKVKICVEPDNRLLRVNGFRITRDDIIQVISNAISYTTQEEFDKYLQYCSQVNLSMQKVLNEGGITFNVYFSGSSDNSITNSGAFTIAMKVSRDKGKNYAVVGGNRYKIKDSTALLDLRRDVEEARVSGGRLQRTIRLLYNSLEGITPKEIATIIADGEKTLQETQERIRKENEEKSKRADEFVDNAVKISKAKKIKDGYEVVGLSGKAYTVNSETLAVYEGKRYICIVDMETDRYTDWGRKDALAKRLLLLAQDLKVANEVHTLEVEA